MSAWNEDSAAHLLRRAAFGAAPGEARKLAELGMEGAVRQLFEQREEEPAPATNPASLMQRRALERKGKADIEAKAALVKFRREEVRAMQDLRSWWMRAMGGANAAREKLALFWHGHFATSQVKVRFVHAMKKQNDAFRRLGMGSFRDLCLAMATDPAMLVWLDGNQNAAKAPNENFAREVMELFTLGEGHYTEDDIREAARAFTGWRIRPEDGEAAFMPRRFDAGQKTIFGQTGNFDAAGAIDLICARPRCAEFLARKLWVFYAYADPSDALVAELGASYRASRLNTGELLEKIFTHPEFYSDRARAAQIKSPVQWAVQASRELERQLLPPGVLLPLVAELGQNLFAPPSVKGWDGGPAWISTATLIRRSNSALLFTTAAPPRPVKTDGSMMAASWDRVVPSPDRASAETLLRRLEKIFLAAPMGPATKAKVTAVLEGKKFPCGDELVAEASGAVLAAPEYQMC